MGITTLRVQLNALYLNTTISYIPIKYVKIFKSLGSPTSLCFTMFGPTFCNNLTKKWMCVCERERERKRERECERDGGRPLVILLIYPFLEHNLMLHYSQHKTALVKLLIPHIGRVPFCHVSIIPRVEDPLLKIRHHSDVCFPFSVLHSVNSYWPRLSLIPRHSCFSFHSFRHSL